MTIQHPRAAEFELVTEIRAAIGKVAVDVAVTTAEEYRTVYRRMMARGEEPAHAKSQSDYYRRRAALLYAVAEQARLAMRERDRSAPNSPTWQQAMSELQYVKTILDRYPPDPTRKHYADGSTGLCWSDVKDKLAAEGFQPAKCSKRKSVSSLTRRSGWRDTLFAASTTAYRNALAVAILTGARPAEIALGVEIQCRSDGLQITVRGAKIGKERGQPTRTLLVQVDCDAARHLASLAGEGSINVTTNPKRFSDAVAVAGRRAFPGLRDRLSPYSLRHVTASALKAAGVDDVALAETLGHRATRSQQAYGRACHGRPDATGIVGVAASMPVRETRRNPASALRRMPGTPRLG